MATLHYDVDVDTARAEARIGSFALGMRRRISDAVRSLPEIQLDANSTDAQRELAELRRQLVELGNQRVGVDISAADATAKLDELKARLAALRNSGDIQIDADVAAALERLGVLDAAVDRVDGRKATVKVDVDKTFSDTLIKVAMLGKSLNSIALGPSALSIIPQVAGIASSISDLTGVAGLLPAVLLAGGAAAGTLAVGFSHVSDALGPAGTPAQLKKVNEALAQLPPNARDTITAIRGMGGAWADIRLDVQTKLFAGMREQVQGLARAELPVLKTGLGGIAVELNKSAAGILDWAKSASTTKDVGTIFTNTRSAMHEMIPVGQNVAATFLDIGTVGTKFMPMLADELTAVTGKFRAFIENARQTGQLQEWMQTGIVKTKELGDVLSNVGHAVVDFFKAASAGGHDFLDSALQVSAELRRFLETPVAQSGIAAGFRELGDSFSNLLPGVRALDTAIAQALTSAARTGGLHEMATAVSDIAVAVAPLIPQLAKLAGDVLHGLAIEAQGVAAVLRPIVGAIGDVLTSLGPLAPAVSAFALSWRVLSPVSGIVTTLGASLSGLAGRLGATEETTGRIATAFSKAGAAIPVLGAAIIGLGVLYDALRDKTDETAAAVLKGSQDFTQAVNDMAAAEQAASQADAARAMTVERTGFATKETAAATRDAVTAEQAHQDSVNKLVDSMRAQVDQLSGVEQAQGRVKIAQVLWNDAVQQFGPQSDQATLAAGNLQIATSVLEAAQREAAAATKTLGDQITETAKAAASAANADVAYQQAVINVAAANDNAAKVAAIRGVSERDLAQANLQVMQANLSAAAAAQRKAEADATATGATNVAQIGAQAYKEELIRLAGQATGPTRDALLAMANGTDTAARAASTAEIAARAEKDELGRLADQATGPLAAAMHTAVSNFDTLGGAHATAEQRAAAQKAELQRLADMASGPVKASLQAMADQVSHLPNGSFTVTATGVTAYKFSSTGEVLGSGNTGLAAGGVWGGPGTDRAYVDSGVMPGNTPGRDVHHFFSPTAGGLHLSGGEAVMRPEWTQAVSGMYGRKYVADANAAARRGGISGVTSFLANTAPGAAGGPAPRGHTRKFSGGGIYDPTGGQHLALGGWINAGKGFSTLAPEVFQRETAEMRGVLVKEVQAKLIAHEAAARAAIARAAAAAAAALGGGGGSAVAGGPVWDVIQRTAAQFGWGGGAEYAALQWIIQHESGGRPNAQNPTSTAYGLFQFLNGTWASTGIAKTSDPALQSLAGMRYIASRYRDPIGAKAFWQAHGWYGRGGIMPAHLADTGAMLSSGHAAINLSGQTERVLSPSETRSYQGGGDGSGRVVDEVSRLRADVRSLSAALAGAGGDTFNISGPDLAESVQSTRMLLRTKR